MVELISSIIFIGSTAAAGVVVARKMPQAVRESELSRELRLFNLRDALKAWLGAKAKNNRYLKDFNWIDFVQKQLLKTRVIVMKAENKINDYTAKLRERADDQKKKEEVLLDNYWRDLKTIVKTKKPFHKEGGRTRSAETEFAGEAEAINANAKKETEITSKSELPSAIKFEPMIGRVVMPEQVLPRESRSKRRHNSKKKKIRDPFKW